MGGLARSRWNNFETTTVAVTEFWELYLEYDRFSPSFVRSVLGKHSTGQMQRVDNWPQELRNSAALYAVLSLNDLNKTHQRSLIPQTSKKWGKVRCHRLGEDNKISNVLLYDSRRCQGSHWKTTFETVPFRPVDVQALTSLSVANSLASRADAWPGGIFFGGYDTGVMGGCYGWKLKVAMMITLCYCCRFVFGCLQGSGVLTHTQSFGCLFYPQTHVSGTCELI